MAWRGATSGPSEQRARPPPGHALQAPGLVGPLPRPPLAPILTPVEETLKIETPFPKEIPISAAIANKPRWTRSSYSGTLPGRGSAPGFISIDVASSP